MRLSAFVPNRIEPDSTSAHGHDFLPVASVVRFYYKCSTTPVVHKESRPVSTSEQDDLGQLSGLQLSILRAIWQRGEASTADVVASLADSRDLAHTTVGTMLTRLEKRGLIESRRDGKHLVYRATIAEADVKRSLVTEFLGRLFDGDAPALVAHLLRERDVRDGDLEQVRALLQHHGDKS